MTDWMKSNAVRLVASVALLAGASGVASAAGLARADYMPDSMYVMFQPGTTSTQLQAFAARYGAASLWPTKYYFGPGDARPAYLIKFKAGLYAWDVAGALNLSPSMSPAQQILQLHSVRQVMRGRATTVVGQLLSEPILQMIAPVYVAYTQQLAPPTLSLPPPAPAPNDPLFPQQWALDGNHLEALQAWGIAQTAGRGIDVAVLDTGYDNTHPDLQQNIDLSHSYDWAFPAGTSSYYIVPPDPGADILDQGERFHGTAVSGVIAATHNNNIGITGLAYNSNIWFEKVSPVFTTAALTGTIDINAEALALQYLTDTHRNSGQPRIINISYGSHNAFQQEHSAIQAATTEGIIVVAAAGNDGGDGLQPGSFAASSRSVNYPAAYPGVWAVGASNFANGVADFSNWNDNTNFVSAPGQQLYTKAHDIDFIAPGAACPQTPVCTATTGTTTAGTTTAGTTTAGTTTGPPSTTTGGGTGGTTGGSTGGTGSSVSSTGYPRSEGFVRGATTGGGYPFESVSSRQATTTTGATTGTNGSTGSGSTNTVTTTGAVAGTTNTTGTATTTATSTATTTASTGGTGTATSTATTTATTGGASTATTGTPSCSTQGILTTVPALSFLAYYTEVEGTSFSTPYVAATAALILGRNPSLTAQQVYHILATSTRTPGAPETQCPPTAGLTTGTTTAGTTTAGTTTAGTTTAGTTTAGTTTAGTTTAGTTTAGTTGGTTTAGTTTAGTTTAGTTTGTTTGITTGTTAGPTTGIPPATQYEGSYYAFDNTNTDNNTGDKRAGHGVVDAAMAVENTPALLVQSFSPVNGSIISNSTASIRFVLDAVDVQAFDVLLNGVPKFSYPADFSPCGSSGGSTGGLPPPPGASTGPMCGPFNSQYDPSTGVFTMQLPYANPAFPVPENLPFSIAIQAYPNGVTVGPGTAQAPVGPTLTLQPTTLPFGWSFISIPAALGASLSDPGTVVHPEFAAPSYVFSGANVTLFRYDPRRIPPAYRQYPPDTFASFLPPDAGPGGTVPDPPAGLGYWIYVADAAGASIHVEGADVPLQLYPIKLYKGWNQVGNPFPFTIDWGGTQVQTADGQYHTLSNASTSSLVLSTAYTYSNAGRGSGYTTLTAPSTNVLGIRPFQGFWVYAYQPVTLLIQPSPVYSALR